MNFWDKYACHFAVGSIVLGIGLIFLAYVVYAYNSRKRWGSKYPKKKQSVADAIFQKLIQKLKRKSDKQKTPQTSDQQRLTWFAEFTPFALVCIASIILPNGFFVIFDKYNIVVPSPLTYENTFILFVPLAWTVGIAFFQYRIQNELIRVQERDKDAENEKKEQQQREHRLGELVSALGSLYACQFSAINFNTNSVPASMTRNYFSACNHITEEGGYAIKIENVNGAPCFYFPYYIFKDDASENIVVKLNDRMIDESYHTILPNALYIVIPPEQSTSEIDDFFVAPLFVGTSERRKLQCSIEVKAQDPFYRDTDKLAGSLIRYTISFQIEQAGGYSEAGSFPLKMIDYKIIEQSEDISRDNLVETCITTRD